MGEAQTYVDERSSLGGVIDEAAMARVSLGTRAEPRDDRLTGWSFVQIPCCTMALYETGLRLRRANEHAWSCYLVGLTAQELADVAVPAIASLMLVAQPTQAWGTRRTPIGATIWVEQALPAP